MDEDTILTVAIVVTWVISVLAVLTTVGFICWGIYKLVIHFL